MELKNIPISLTCDTHRYHGGRRRLVADINGLSRAEVGRRMWTPKGADKPISIADHSDYYLPKQAVRYFNDLRATGHVYFTNMKQVYGEIVKPWRCTIAVLSLLGGSMYDNKTERTF